jgi:uncharacterized membrane protein
MQKLSEGPSELVEALKPVSPAEQGPGVWPVSWTWERQKALSPKALWGALLGLCAVSLSIGLLFWWRGVPWVAPFAGLECLAVGAALTWQRRHSEDRERVSIDPEAVVVEWVVGGRSGQQRWSPAWLKVEAAGLGESPLVLRGYGRSAEVGRFLSPEARLTWALELRGVLHVASASISSSREN